MSTQMVLTSQNTTGTKLSGQQTILVAGATGMVGSALCRKLALRGFGKVLTPTRQQLDLLDQSEVYKYLLSHRPDVVIVAAARVGGIHANATYPAEFLHHNLAIASHLIEGSHRANIDRLLFLGSTCIYPRQAPQPMAEEALLTGPLEPTNEAYAIAKIVGVKLCQVYRKQYGRDYISAMPTNLYGPGDNYHPENSHVLPALLRRFVESQEQGLSEVVVWGTGNARREFLYVDDAADAFLYLLDHYHGSEPINVGCEDEVTIRELAEMIQAVVGFKGRLVFDTTRPDGPPRKKADTRRLESLGWRAGESLQQGLSKSLDDFLKRRQSIRQV